MAGKWLDRAVAPPGPYLTLCLSESEFKQAMRQLKADGSAAWVNSGAQATCHHFHNQNGSRAALVCLRDWEGRAPAEVAGILIHEAVHVWQSHCECIGERNPGDEQQAYGIQFIAQELIAEFGRRMATCLRKPTRTRRAGSTRRVGRTTSAPRGLT